MSGNRRLRIDSENLSRNNSASGSINTSNKLFLTPTHSRSPSVRTEYHNLICKEQKPRLAQSTSLNNLHRANSLRSSPSYHYTPKDSATSNSCLKRTSSTNKSQRFRRTQSFYSAPTSQRRRSQKRQPQSTNGSTNLLPPAYDGSAYLGLIPAATIAKEPIEPEAVQQMQVTLVREAKERRRRVVVTVVVVTFCLLLLFSVLAVLVTLTHQSEMTVGNVTVPYYTFSPSLPVTMREQNRDLLKSLQREPAVTTLQPPNISQPQPQTQQMQQQQGNTAAAATATLPAAVAAVA